ncbi:MAG: endonuclease III [Candidatus Micrarchaeaceae archaeon]
MQNYETKIIRRLAKRYGVKQTALKHANITELFVAAMLSPQCTDKQVNSVTSVLFKEFDGFDAYANANLATLEKKLKGLNYYRTKARNLRNAARIILKDFGGEVPRTISELITLPGIGRKVANVILNEGYGITEGIAVDTHCITVSNRLGLTRSKDPKIIEKDLMKRIPERYWPITSNLFIALGRDTCTARKKECYRCVLKDICKSSNAKGKKSKLR